MTSAIRHVTVGSADPYRLAAFWSQVLGLPVHEDDKPGDEDALIEGAGLLFVTVGSGRSRTVSISTSSHRTVPATRRSSVWSASGPRWSTTGGLRTAGAGWSSRSGGQRVLRGAR